MLLASDGYSLMIVFIEMRLGYQYLGGPWDTFHGYDV
jgi:hypothetical protein